MRPDHNSDRSDGLIEVPARLVLRFGSITLAVVYAVGTGIGLAPIRTFVDHLVEYSHIPRPWDDAAVGGGLTT